MPTCYSGFGRGRGEYRDRDFRRWVFNGRNIRADRRTDIEYKKMAGDKMGRSAILRLLTTRPDLPLERYLILMLFCLESEVVLLVQI